MPVMKGWNILTNSEKSKKARYFVVTTVDLSGGDYAAHTQESSRQTRFLCVALAVLELTF
jgi:hypothetical protein